MDLRIEKYMGDEGDGWYVLEGGYCTQPEGHSREWMEVAAALRERRPAGFKRLALRWESGFGELCSPRNAYDRKDCALIHESEADELADHIISVLKESGERCLFGEYDPIAAGA